MKTLTLLALLASQEVDLPVVIKAGYDLKGTTDEVTCTITWRDGAGSVIRRLEKEDGKITRWKGAFEKADLDKLLETLKKHKVSEQKTDVCHGEHTDVSFWVSVRANGRKSGCSQCFCRERNADGRAILDALRAFIERHATEAEKE